MGLEAIALRELGLSATAVVRQVAASETLTMTARPMTVPGVAGVFAAGPGPPAGPGQGMEA